MDEHTESNKELNRRRFLRCSAAAAAAFALHRGVDPASESTALAAKSTADPSENYPWNVAVGERGRILLCLLDSSSIDNIRDLTFDRSVYSTLRTLRSAVNRAYRKFPDLFPNELAKLGVDAGELKSRLAVARSALKDEGIKHWRYRDFAVRESENWGKGLAVPSAYEALSSLDEIITFPPLRCNSETAQEFYSRWDDLTKNEKSSFRHAFAHGVNGDHWSGKRTLAAALQDGRQSGIFWCYPAAERVPGSQYSIFEEEEEGEQYQTCVGGTCTVTGDPNDYCQMVNGSCNPMSGGG